jgi:delta 1-pyrroline-5-carboxylate dehydrogenase
MKISQSVLLAIVGMVVASCATQQPERALFLKQSAQPTWDSALIRLYERAAYLGRRVQSMEGFVACKFICLKCSNRSVVC